MNLHIHGRSLWANKQVELRAGKAECGTDRRPTCLTRVASAYTLAMPRLNTYEQLLSINTGFELVRKALGALSRGNMFDRKELARFEAWSEETRSSINSYLLGVVEAAETDLAGRLYRRRLARERNDDSDGA